MTVQLGLGGQVGMDGHEEADAASAADAAANRRAARGLVVAIDVGGSKIAAALVTRGGEAHHVRRVPTAREDLEALLAQLQDLVDDLLARGAGAVDAISLAVPGTLDPATGTAIVAANLPWRHTPLAELFSLRTGIRTIVGGDGEGATLAERWFGAARGHPTYACLTIGTGIGGGVVVDGAFLRGGSGRGPEIGHMVVAPDGPRCRCGGRGCLEAVAAGPAIAARTRALDGTAEDGRSVVESARAADPRALRALAEAGGYLAMALVTLWRLFEPSVFILGGGLASAGDLLLQPLRARLEELAPPRARLGSAVRWSGLSGDASYLAAVALQREADARAAQAVRP